MRGRGAVWLAVLAAAAAAALVLAGCTSSGTAQPTQPTQSTQASPSVTTTPDIARDGALRQFFSSDVRWLNTEVGGLSMGGSAYCGLEVMGGSADGHQLYLWVDCQEFYAKDGSLHDGSGSSTAVLATVSGSGPTTTVTAWKVPGDDAQFATDVKAWFPADVAARMVANQVDPVPRGAELRQQAILDLLPASGP